MAYADTMRKIRLKQKRIGQLRARIRAMQAAIEPEAVDDYEFEGPDGVVKLSKLFAGKPDLILIHSMGRSCAYCTMWADGFNGLYDHIADRAAFAVVSPDAPDVQQRLAKQRGWRFPMASAAVTSFMADMGYEDAKGRAQPGVSVFRKPARKIFRVSDQPMGPGDDFNAAWHLFDLIPEGAAGWSPKKSYG